MSSTDLPSEPGQSAVPGPEVLAAVPLAKPTAWKAALYLAALLVAFFVTDRSIAYLFDHLVGRSQFRLSRIYRGDLKAEVLIIGNSRGVNGFFAPAIQEQLQRPVYNLSFNSMNLENVHVFLGDYLEHNSAPKILVVEITSMLSYGIIKGVKFLSGRSDRVSAQLQSNHHNLWMAGEISHVYRYNTEIFFRALYYLNSTDQNSLNTCQIDHDIAEEYVLPHDEYAKWKGLAPKQIAALRSIVQLAREKHIELRLTVTPYLPNYIRQLDLYPQWLAAVKTAVGPDTLIWDYSNTLTDNAYFADMVHLNKEGSLLLLQQMKKDHFFDPGALPPHRAPSPSPSP